jgi:hypothetical protein
MSRFFFRDFISDLVSVVFYRDLVMAFYRDLVAVVLIETLLLWFFYRDLVVVDFFLASCYSIIYIF